MLRVAEPTTSKPPLSWTRRKRLSPESDEAKVEMRSSCCRILVVSTLQQSMATSVLLPTLPILISDTLGMSTTSTGMAFLSLALGSMIGFGLSITASKVFSTAYILQVCFACRAIAGIIHSGISFVPENVSFPMIISSRFIHGLSQASMATCQSWVATRLSPSERQVAVGNLAQSLIIGLIVGPPLGSVLSAMTVWLLPLVNVTYHFSTVLAETVLPGQVIAITSLMLMYFTTSMFHEPKGPMIQNRQNTGVQDHATTFGVCKMFATTVCAQALATFGFVSSESLLSLFLLGAYGWDERQSGFVFLYAAILLLGAMRMYQRAIASTRYLSAIKLFMTLIGLLSVLSTCYATRTISTNTVGSICAFLIGFGCMGMSYGLTIVSANSCLSISLPAHLQAPGNAVKEASNMLARALGPMIATFLLSTDNVRLGTCGIIGAKGMIPNNSDAGGTLFRPCGAHIAFIVLSTSLLLSSFIMLSPLDYAAVVTSK